MSEYVYNYIAYYIIIKSIFRLIFTLKNYIEVTYEKAMALIAVFSVIIMALAAPSMVLQMTLVYINESQRNTEQS